jgi:hypothetical protein
MSESQEMFLLGAGASFEADIPTATGMVEKFIEKFESDPLHKHYAEIAKFVVGGMLFQAGIEGRNPLGTRVNVEDFFNAIELLSKRHSLEAAPFIGSWHDKIDQFDSQQPTRVPGKKLVRELFDVVQEEIRDALKIKSSGTSQQKLGGNLLDAVSDGIEQIIKKKRVKSSTKRDIGKAVDKYLLDVVKSWNKNLDKARPSSNSKLDRLLVDVVDSAQSEPGGGRIFDEMMQVMVDGLISFTWVEDPSRVEHLEPLVRLAE